MSAPSITKPFLERYPEARYWLDLGFQPNVAKALVTAGYLKLADLAGKFREDLTAIRGFGSFSLAKCEALLGSPFPSRTEELAKSEIHPLVRNALERAGIRSLADLAKLTREQFLAIPGFGPKGLLQCEREGWLLIGCDQHEQALALWQSVRRRRGVLANRYDLAGGSHRRGLDADLPLNIWY